MRLTAEIFKNKKYTPIHPCSEEHGFPGYGFHKNKRKRESFSSVIRRKTKKNKNIMDFAGAWKNTSDKEARKIKEDIYNLRKKSTKDLVRKF